MHLIFVGGIILVDVLAVESSRFFSGMPEISCVCHDLCRAMNEFGKGRECPNSSVCAPWKVAAEVVVLATVEPWNNAP